MPKKPKTRMKHCKDCGELSIIRSNYCQKCRNKASRFGVSPEELHELRTNQSNQCGICHRYFLGDDRAMVDHDHKTSHIRGFLCRRCNIGLGFLSTIDLLQAAQEYLKKGPAIVVTPALITPTTLSPEEQAITQKYLQDLSFTTSRARARALAWELKISPEAALSRLRRAAYQVEVPRQIKEILPAMG